LKLTEKKKNGSIKQGIKLTWRFLSKIINKFCGFLTARINEEEKKTQFLVNMCAGLVVLVLMQFAANTKWVEGVINNAFDEFIQKDARKAATKEEIADTGDIFLIDLHHIKPEKSGEEVSYISPRDTIAQIIKMAAHGNAKVIVLDVILEKKDEKDQELRNILETFSTDKNFQTKIIFAQRVGKDGTLKRNLFDPLIDKNPNFYRAIPTLYVTKQDRVIRYWKAYDLYGKRKIIWGIPVLAVILNEGRLADLKEYEKQLTQKGTGVDNLVVNFDKNKTFVLPAGNKDLYRQRIHFSLIPRDCVDGFPAGNLILPTMESLHPRRFENKVVLIGSSDPEKGDIQPTPVGDMSGMYIHGNAIHILLQGLQPAPAPWWIAIVLDIVVIIFVPYYFLYLESWLAKLIGTIVLTTALAFVSYYVFFRFFGMFFSFAFVTAAVGYFDTFSGIRETILKMKEKNKRSPRSTRKDTEMKEGRK
jgi:CHASE2 domain-containing sensor protein